MSMLAADAGQFCEGAGREAGARHLSRERQCIVNAQHGDVSAFNELVRLYQARAYRLAYRVLGDAEAADDATQEAFISAYQHLAALRGDSFGGWLMRIVRNACYDELRRKQRQHTFSQAELSENSDRPFARPARADPELLQELVERGELNDVIQQGIAELPFDQRVTLVLADVEGYAYEQIAGITHVKIGTVKSRLARGRGSLRTFLLSKERLLPAKYRWSGPSAHSMEELTKGF